MRKGLILLALAALIAIPTRMFAGELDKTEWKMRLRGVKSFLMFWKSDQMIFENGQFTSRGCIPFGFNSSSYDSKKEGDRVTWSTVQVNTKGEKTEWKGISDGLRMEGSFTWTRADGKIKTYWWYAKKIRG